MKRIPLTVWISFPILLACLSCRKQANTPRVSIISENGKSIGLSITNLDITENEILNRLTIRLVKDGEPQSVLGQFKHRRHEITFEPVIPFTSGLRYAVMLDDSLIAEIKIPEGDHISPELLSIYPTRDTVPENLLKMYLEFSQPMVEGRSLDHITLLDHDGDTMKGTFLDLQPELWNAEGTVLTLWLDPGRIKRDLIPNKALGTPLKEGEEYFLHVDSSWRSKRGSALLQTQGKTFVALYRDETSPDLSTWDIKAPVAGKIAPLEVRTPEPIDYFLFREALQIVSSAGNKVYGKVHIADGETVYQFVPEKPWAKGKYTLYVEGRLEDLAGNNLERVFDRNVESVDEQHDQKSFSKVFEIH